MHSKNIFKFKFLLFAINIFIYNKSISQNGVSINTTGAHADNSAILDVSSTTQGLLVPRMRTTNRNNITTPIPESLLIYNNDTHCFEAYFNGGWVAFGCLGGCQVPAHPTAGTNLPSSNSIVWNWSNASSPVSYKCGTTNDYSSATDVGTNTSYTQTGLTCGTVDTLYVWANNACGNSSYSILIQSASACTCNEPNIITQVNGKTIYTFYTSGTFTPTFTGNVSVLVVAGGGGGGTGGGGAGGVVYNANFPVTNGTPYTVTVGLGGAGGVGGAPYYGTIGSNGQNSVFSTIIAIGGGAGSYMLENGLAGGSGGGGAGYGNTVITPFAGGSGIAGQGNNGGSSYGLNYTPYWSGGGGGAGAAGENGTVSAGGAGGIGISNSISSAAIYYGGGGGSGPYTCCGGWVGSPGGLGGGGNGGSSACNCNGDNGASNTGGGGGGTGDCYHNGGDGGCGVVIISY